MTVIGTCVKRLREAKGLSLQGVADRAALSKAHVWEVESGSVTNPTIKTLCCLAVALDCPPDQLAGAAITDCMNALRVETVAHNVVMPAVLNQ